MQSVRGTMGPVTGTQISNGQNQNSGSNQSNQQDDKHNQQQNNNSFQIRPQYNNTNSNCIETIKKFKSLDIGSSFHIMFGNSDQGLSFGIEAQGTYIICFGGDSYEKPDANNGNSKHKDVKGYKTIVYSNNNVYDKYLRYNETESSTDESNNRKKPIILSKPRGTIALGAMLNFSMSNNICISATFGYEWQFYSFIKNYDDGLSHAIQVFGKDIFKNKTIKKGAFYIKIAGGMKISRFHIKLFVQFSIPKKILSNGDEFIRRTSCVIGVTAAANAQLRDRLYVGISPTIAVGMRSLRSNINVNA